MSDARLAAIRCRDLTDARETVTDLQFEGFQAEAIEHDGVSYAVVTENSAGTVEDTLFELSFHGFDTGTVPADVVPSTPEQEGNRG